MNLSKKQEYLIIAGLLVLIFPFFALLLYVHPQGDDFFFAAKVNEMGVLPFVKDMYLHWSGRYASMFIGAFDPLRFESLLMLRLSLFFFQTLFVLSLFSFFSSIAKPTVSKVKILIFTLSFYAISINAIPDVFEFLYWIPSVTAYMLGLTLLLFFISNILFREHNRINPTFFVITNSILAFISVGLLELFIPPFTVASVLITLYRYKKYKPIKWDIVILIITVLFSIIMFIAPGNFQRMGSEGLNFYKIMAGIYLAIKSMIYLVGFLFQNPVYILGNLLFIGFIDRLLKRNTVSINKIFKVKPFYILISSAILVFLMFFPTTLALNVLPAGRIFSLAAFVFSILLLLNITVFVKKYQTKVEFSISKFYTRIIILLMVMLTFSGIYVTNMYEFAKKKEGSVLLYGNILNAYNTLLFEAKPFDEEMNQRYQDYKNAQSKKDKTLVVKPFKHHPEMLIFVDITDLEEPGTWIYNWEAQYYGMDSIRIESNNNVISDKAKKNIYEK